MAQTASQQVATGITSLDGERAPECPERRRALDALRECEQRYRALLDGLDAIVWQVDLPEPTSLHDHSQVLPFSFVSQQAEAILGYPVEQWLSEPDFWINHIHPDDRERMLAHCCSAAPEPREHEAEYRLLAADGRVVWVRDRIRLVRDADGRPRQLCGLIEDITERRQAEETLRASEERFRTLVENAFDAIALTRADGTLIYASPGDRTFSLDPREVVGRNWAERVHPDDLEHCMAQFIALLQRPHQRVIVQTRVRGRDGSWRWVEAIGRNLLDNPRVQAIVVNSRDITERKQAEADLNRSREQLRALSARLQAVREEERTRIAREIHDELGQTLTGLKLDLAWLQKRVAPLQPPREVVERIATMSDLVGTTIRSVGKISSDLRPAALDDLGLTAAIQWQLKDFQLRSGIQCEFKSSSLDSTAVGREVATGLFRMLQEALTNVTRHAQATHVRITLEERAGQLVMEVADDGRGMTAAEGLGPHALGLLGMRERARLLDGQVTISSTPGRGTTVTVCIPGTTPGARRR